MQALIRVAPLLAVLALSPLARGQVSDTGTGDGKSKSGRKLPGEDWSGSLGVGTNFPLDLGARFTRQIDSANLIRRALEQHGILPRTIHEGAVIAMTELQNPALPLVSSRFRDCHTSPCHP